VNYKKKQLYFLWKAPKVGEWFTRDLAGKIIFPLGFSALGVAFWESPGGWT